MSHDSTLLESWHRRRDAEAFREIVRRHGGLVYGTCRRILGSEADAEDVAQDCFLELSRSGQNIRTSLVGWLHRLATCRSLDHIKRETRRRRSEDARRQDRIELHSAEWSSIQPFVDEAIDSLPEDLRAAVVGYYLEQKSYEALGRRYGVTHSTMRNRATRGLDAIRRHLRERGVATTAVFIGSALSTRLLEAAPASLLATLGRVAVSGASPAPAPLAAKAARLAEVRRSPSTLAAPSVSMPTLAGVATLLAVSLSILAVLAWPDTESDEIAAVPTTVPPGADASRPASSEGATVTVDEGAGRNAPTAMSSLEVHATWAGTEERVPDARIRLKRESDGDVVQDVTTNESGAAILQYRREWKRVWIVASHALAIDFEVPFEIPQNPRVESILEFPLSPQRTVVGTIFDSTSRQPIPGARLDWRGGGETAAVADDEGDYVVTTPRLNSLAFDARADGYAPKELIVHVTEPGRTRRDIFLNPAIDVVVTVVDSDGQPLEGVKVASATKEHGGYSSFGPESYLTDHLGQAVVSRDSTFRRRDPTINASKPGYALESKGEVTQGSDGNWSLRIVLTDLSRHRRVVVGQVRDEHGPVEGAVLGYNDGIFSWGAGGAQRSPHAVTDEHGRYRLEFENQKTSFLITAYARGHAPAFEDNVQAGSSDAPARLDFFLEPGTWLRGQVVDEDGKPLEGVRVTVEREGKGYSASQIVPGVPDSTRTDELGRFSLSDVAGPEARVDFSPLRSGHCSATRRVAVEREAQHVLWRKGVVRGRVVEADTDEPVPHFTIRITDGTGYSSSRGVTGESFSSTEGRFLVDRLYRGEEDVPFSFAVDAEGYLPGRLENVLPMPNEDAPEHVVRLDAGTDTEGYVLAAETGTPLSDVVVIRRDAHGGVYDWMAPGGSNVERQVTGTDGSFRFREPAAGVLLFQRPGYGRRALHPRERTGMADRDGRLRVLLEAAAAIAGSLSDDPRVVSKSLSLVRLDTFGAPSSRPRPRWREAARLLGGGRFEWTQLARGPYHLELSLRPTARARETRVRERMDLSSGERTERTIGGELGPLTFRGRLMPSSGAPSARYVVVLTPTFEWRYREFETTADAEGRFEIGGLRPGAYSGRVYRPEDREQPLAEWPAVRVDAARSDLEVELRM